MNEIMTQAIPQNKPRIGREEIAKACEILKEYKQQKTNLESKIIENEQWYRLRQWECMRKSMSKKDNQKDDVEPTSAWLFDAIINKHADAMDNIPSANILPREESDIEEAERLSSIIPVVLKQCKFEETYDSNTYDKIISGLCVYGVFWDKTKLNGLGDINIAQVDPLNIFWEPGISDIQKSANIFTVELRRYEDVISEFPELKLNKEMLSESGDLKPADYRYDDAVSTEGKCLVIDWYYKVRQGARTILHYVKFVGNTVLYASENDTEFETEERYDEKTGNAYVVKLSDSVSETGFYADGSYPFVFDRCFPMKGSPAGFGYIDVEKNPQEFIDRTDKAVLKNVLFNAMPRHFSRIDGGINEDEFNDPSKPVVHVEGMIDDTHIRTIPQNPLPAIYMTVLDRKVSELKETAGNRDVANGGTTSGVTAASGIAAMQEASGKKSRDFNQASYRRFEELIIMVIERIRQFYDLPRQFRIVGKDGQERFISYSNEKLRLQSQGMAFGEDMLYRLPVFDIEVSAQKKSAYTKLSQNELALQLYSGGFFAPENTDAASACLEMMDFDRKSLVLKRIQQNGLLMDRLIQIQQLALGMASELDAIKGTNMAAQLYAQFTGDQSQISAAGAYNAKLSESENKESAHTARAREKTASLATPN